MTTEEFNRLQAVADGSASSQPPAFEPNIEKYRHELEDFDLDRETETELLLTLWQIMSVFVDKGFTVDICAHVFGPDDILDQQDEKGGKA